MMRNAEIIDAVCPVEQMVKYGNGVYRLVRKSKLKSKPNPYLKRGKISKMSTQSLARLIATIQATEVSFASMITLTYPEVFPDRGKVVKSDIGWYTTWLRRRWETEYLWFLEFQKRGAPHVHVLVENVVVTPTQRVEAGLKWTERIMLSEWLSAVHSNKRAPAAWMGQLTWKVASVNCHPTFWEIIREPAGARKYVTKYAAKQIQKQVPETFIDVGRFWGSSRGVQPEEVVTLDVSDDEVRDWLRSNNHQAADWDVLPKWLFNVQDVEKDD